MTPKEINALRVLLKKASRPPARTKAEHAAHFARVKKARRDAYRAEALAAVQAHWDERAAYLRAVHGPRCFVEVGLGERPTVYDKSVNFHYERLQNRCDNIN